MAPTRRAVLGMTAVTIGLAGCSGAGGGDGSSGASPTPDDGATNGGMTTTGVPTTSGGGTASATVAVSDHPELGEILVDGDGTTLYMFDSDERGAGVSNCSDDCAQAWPPLTVDGSPRVAEGVTAEVTTFDREDGSTQVAAGGWPLYYWQGDQSPGDATGQGVNDVWWVLDPSGAPIRET